jgi:hypothetical protein
MYIYTRVYHVHLVGAATANIRCSTVHIPHIRPYD